MKDIFYNTMVSTESPGGYKSATRQGYNLGGFQARYKSRQIRLVTFSPPRIRASCGGIDAFAGAFSMISGEQLVQSARALAQGAATYAFGIAIDAMCPSCAAEMKHLNKWLNELNKFASMSCKDAAEKIASTDFMSGLKAEGAKREATILPNLLPTGMFDDFMAGKNETNPSNAQDIKDAGKEKEASYNIMWHAMRSANQQDFQIDGVDSLTFMEIMMSLTGTVVTCFDQALCGDSTVLNVNTDDGSVSKVYPGTLKFKSFILGPEAEGYDNGRVEMLQCSDPDTTDRENNCLFVKRVDVEFKGLKQLFLEIIWGQDPFTPSSTSVIGYIQGRNVAMDTNTLNFVSHSGNGLVHSLRQTLFNGEATTNTYKLAEMYAELTAYQIASNWLSMVNTKIMQLGFYKPKTDKQFVEPADLKSIKERAMALNAEKRGFETEMQNRMQFLTNWLDSQRILRDSGSGN
ncbi:conjugal transfer protein TraH [Motilimonas eburnea]|uniref:conjugal transfer protein TraH n=1 Tax=Motilimonas eburnea TaxID=1737488 RepID=UPI001E3E1109|nr:conjugal transfer protein TraH [Motilimonas eburnea]MCE2571783.1 conjugal transfer protein TraH [Motilimonas eburnea]